MNINKEKIDIIYRFLSVKGIGIVQTNKLLLKSQQERDIFTIENEIRDILTPEQFNEYQKIPSIVPNIKSKFPVDFISLTDIDYPTELKKYLKTNSPPLLSIIGNINLLKKKKVAFSGSRKVSEKGISIANSCVEQLIEKDSVIVSGYAKGVDLTTHSTALKNGGETIIILAEGINYFNIKGELKDIWDWNRVLVISEFKPQEKWMASRAMKRNDTIIGLCDIIVVVEAGETGGSLDAGEKTLSYGKPLFVPQYSVIPESALGNDILLRKGAFPIKMSKETSRPNLTKMFSFFNSSDTFLLF